MTSSLDVSTNSWKLIPISDVLIFQEGPGVRKYRYTEPGVKLLNGSNINNNILDLSNTKRFISDKEAFGKYSHFLVDEGDLLIACSGIVVDKFDKKIAYAKKEHLPLCMNTSTMRFKTKNPRVFHLNYFKYFLATRLFKDQLRKLITGSAQLNFGPSHIAQMFVPLPPLKEQKRIAAILDKADAIRRKRQQAIELADQFLRSVFLDMFGDPATNPKRFPTKTIEEFISNEKYALKRGPFGGALKKEIFVESGYLVYEQFHALNNDFTFQRYFIDENKFNELKAFEVKPKDIIISCSGVNLGRLAEVPQGAPRGIINQALMKIKLNNKIMTNSMFIHIFSHPNFKSAFYGDFRGAAIPNFPPMSTFKEFKFIVPPMELQLEYQAVVDRVQKERMMLDKSQETMNTLFGSLTSRAFKGELPPTRAA